MKYKKFSFENYRGIKDCLEFELNTTSTVPYCIIGNNESGKTTILKGIELIGELCEGTIIENGKRKSIKPKGDYFSGNVKLGAVVDCDVGIIKQESTLQKYIATQENIDISFEFVFEFQRSSFSSTRTNINFNNNLITNESDKKAIFDLVSENAPEIIYYDDFKFTVPQYIRFLETNKQCPNKSELESLNNKHWQQIFNDILKGHDSNADSFQKDVVDWYHDKNNDTSISDSRLRNMGKYLDRILAEWIKNKSNIEGFEIIRKQPDKDEDKVFNDYQIKIISGSHSYDMNERSKGLQWSFCFHILTKIRQNRHNAGFIFLLDEPANNLHIRPQKQMLQHLKDLCNTNSTVIYSTHAPELIGTNDENYNNTLIAKNNADEFQTTDIKLHKLKDVSKQFDIQDVEPILAKLSYDDIKSISNNIDDKKKWNEIWDKIKSIKPDIDTSVKLANIGNFFTNVVKIFM